MVEHQKNDLPIFDPCTQATGKKQKITGNYSWFSKDLFLMMMYQIKKDIIAVVIARIIEEEKKRKASFPISVSL
jgi:hypothetical protein